MSFVRFTIFLALFSGTLSCRNNFTATTSNSMGSITGVKGGKALQVSIINPETRAKTMVLMPYFRPNSNGINSSWLYFKPLAFIEGRTIFDENSYTFLPGKNKSNDGFFLHVDPYAAFDGYHYFNGKPRRFDKFNSVYKDGWAVAGYGPFTATGDLLFENQILDNRRPTANMQMELFVPVHGPMSNGFDFLIKNIKDNGRPLGRRLEGGMKLKTTSHYVRQEASGDVIILAKTNFIDDLVIREAIGLPVYSSDKQKIVGFVEAYARGQSKTGDMNLRILSIHSPRLKATLDLWEQTSQVKIKEEISDQWKQEFCSKGFIQNAIKDRIQENKSPIRCQAKQPAILPKAPWDQVPGIGWCNAAAVDAAIEAAVAADDDKKNKAAVCCTVSPTKPTWINDSFNEDYIRRNYCDPAFVREAIARAIANDKACKPE